MNWQSFLFVGIGGFIGSVLRYGVGEIVRKFWENSFPLSTFIVNILGSLLIGFVSGLLIKSELGDSWLKLLVITGFCGGFTTFSSFTIDNIQLMKEGNFTISFIYILLSLFLGLLAVFTGLAFTK